MATSTPIRRPLAALNSNHALTPQAFRITSQALKSPAKSAVVGKALAIAREGEERHEVRGFGSADWKHQSYTVDEHDTRAHKRQRIIDNDAQDSISQDSEKQRRDVEGPLDGDEPDQPNAQKELEDQGYDSPVPSLESPSREDNPSSPASSQDSSVASTTAALNDSQITTVTVPDEDLDANWFTVSQSMIAPRPLTTEEVKQKAREIRLRLSLANYKVRTNQIDVPISRLQIRSSTHPRKPQPTSRRTRTPLPSTSIPRTTSPTNPSAPPTPHIQRIEISPVKQNTSGLSTPLLPRQREGLLNPPLLGIPEERRLTSSAVKGHAADGLLSLMRA